MSDPMVDVREVARALRRIVPEMGHELVEDDGMVAIRTGLMTDEPEGIRFLTRSRGSREWPTARFISIKALRMGIEETERAIRALIEQE